MAAVRLLFWALLPGVLLWTACRPSAPEISYEIVRTFPHDSLAFTQGLLFHGGHLYESTGQYGESTLRRVDAGTGRVVARTRLDSAYFGEGLARVGSELIQLTWKSGVAFVYDLETLERKRTLEYTGQGWGLCFDGASLYMSDGSGTLRRRDPETFGVLSELQVLSYGFELSGLNELECVGDQIYANVYQTDRIVRIDKTTGEVTGELDGFSLRMAGRPPDDGNAVLNGIAYIPETDVFLVTGKLWPTVLAIRLDER